VRSLPGDGVLSVVDDGARDLVDPVGLGEGFRAETLLIQGVPIVPRS
jgi:hypothetical protein